MNEILAALYLALLLSGIAVLLERSHRRAAGRPRLPFGADPRDDADLWRLRHDLDVSR